MKICRNQTLFNVFKVLCITLLVVVVFFFSAQILGVFISSFAFFIGLVILLWMNLDDICFYIKKHAILKVFVVGISCVIFFFAACLALGFKMVIFILIIIFTVKLPKILNSIVFKTEEREINDMKISFVGYLTFYTLDNLQLNKSFINVKYMQNIDKPILKIKHKILRSNKTFCNKEYELYLPK